MYIHVYDGLLDLFAVIAFWSDLPRTECPNALWVVGTLCASWCSSAHSGLVSAAALSLTRFAAIFDDFQLSWSYAQLLICWPWSGCYFAYVVPRLDIAEWIWDVGCLHVGFATQLLRFAP